MSDGSTQQQEATATLPDKRPADELIADGSCIENDTNKRPRTSEAGPSATEAPLAKDKALAAPAQALTIPSDELVAAAPKLVAALRVPAKSMKVADKVASLLEEAKVFKLSNVSAMFDILSAGVEDPTRWRKSATRSAYRRLYSAAASRLSYFSLQQQPSIRVWQFRVTTQADLTAGDPDKFASAVLELKKRLQQLPCANPDDEPRSSAQPGYSHLQPGAWRDHLPERTRPMWCAAIFESLEVVVLKFEGPQQWTRADVNTLVKCAHQRRQNFPAPQQEVILRRARTPDYRACAFI